MVDKEQIKAILDKVDVEPFYFGGDNASYFWRIAKFEEFIYAERAALVYGEMDDSFYCCLACDEQSRNGIYGDLLTDFCMYYRKFWRRKEKTDAFSNIAGPYDIGLLGVLEVFYKNYACFLNDVMYYYSIIEETQPNDDDGVVEIKRSELSEDARLAKRVLERTAKSDPVAVVRGDETHLWQIVPLQDKIWFSKITMHSHGDYIFVSEEYGRIAAKNEDAFDALRDAVKSSFYIDGWTLLDTDADIDAMLAFVGLSLKELSEA